MVLVFLDWVEGLWIRVLRLGFEVPKIGVEVLRMNRMDI